MKCRVNLFAIVTVPVDVEAESHQEAIKAAEEKKEEGISALFANLEGQGSTEYQGILKIYVIEKEGDKGLEKGTWYQETAPGRYQLFGPE